MPDVIRTVTRSTLIAQYLELCQEESFEPLSQATLYRILEVRGTSQRKALKGLDNVAAEGTAAFETLDKVVKELQKASTSPEWIVNIKERLNQGKKYLKTDYKVHCKEDSSPCACMRCMINYQSSIQYTMIHSIFVIYVRHRSLVHLTLKC